jgi:plastocyanin
VLTTTDTVLTTTDTVLTIVKVSGDDQSDSIGAVLQAPLVVRVVDQEGTPVERVEVLWEVIRPTDLPGAYPTFLLTGTHTARTMTTSEGLAGVEMRLGSNPGSWEIRASISARTGEPAETVAFLATSRDLPPTRLEWRSDPYFAYRPDPDAPAWMTYLAWDVTLTGVSFTRPLSVAAVDAEGNDVFAPIEWSVLAGDAVLTAHPTISTAIVTPRADGPIVVEAVSAGLPAIADTLYGAATIILTVGSGDGHCEEGSFVPSTVTIPVGRSVAWSVCDWDGTDGWLLRDGEWFWEYEHDVTFEDGVVTWANTTEDWRPHLRAFSAPGTYRYRCTLHSNGFDDPEGEVGVVIVR